VFSQNTHMEFKSQDNNPYSFKVKLEDKNFQLEQNVQAYRDYAAQQRELDSISHSGRQYRSFAIIPDIVAIDILTKYGIDIHDPSFMQDPALVRKFKQIIDSDYPLLKTSNVKMT
jgi:hypothetical protein